MSHQNVDLQEILHRSGYRLTPQRQLVLDAVCLVGGHASPEQIYDLVIRKAPAVNRATVYRVLKFFLEMNLLTATYSASGRLEYELAQSVHHHHLVCRLCGQDVVFADKGFNDLVDNLQGEFDFRVETNHITLTGLCNGCRSEE